MTKEQIEANKAKLAECYGKEYVWYEERIILTGLDPHMGTPIFWSQKELRWVNCLWASLTEIKEPRRIFIQYAENGSVVSITPDPIIGIGANVEEYVLVTPEIKAKLGIE